MGQAKNRGSLEERVQNAKKLKKDEILKELQRLIEGHYQHVPSQFSHHHNYLDGCVIAMDTKDAMDIALDNDDLGIFEDGYPHPEYISGLFNIAVDKYEFDDSETIQEHAAWIDEDLSMNTMFLRFRNASQFDKFEDVLKAVNEFSFWSPIYIMLNGVWYDTYGIGAVDDNGNTLGIRF